MRREKNGAWVCNIIHISWASQGRVIEIGKVNNESSHVTIERDIIINLFCYLVI